MGTPFIHFYYHMKILIKEKKVGCKNLVWPSSLMLAGSRQVPWILLEVGKVATAEHDSPDLSVPLISEKLCR